MGNGGTGVGVGVGGGSGRDGTGPAAANGEPAMPDVVAKTRSDKVAARMIWRIVLCCIVTPL